jgi:hypothetical protein
VSLLKKGAEAAEAVPGMNWLTKRGVNLLKKSGVNLLEATTEADEIKKWGIDTTTFVSVEDLTNIPGDVLIKILKSLYKKCSNNLEILIKNEQLIKNPSWTIPYYTVKRTLIFSKNNEQMVNLKQAIVTLVDHTFHTIIGNTQKLIKLKKKQELSAEESSELVKLIENEQTYKPYLDLLKKKLSDENKYIKFIERINLKSSNNEEELQKFLQSTMSNLPENAKLIATKNSTGWIDAKARIKSANRNDIELMEGSTEHADLQKLFDGAIDGLMRGSNYAITLTDKYKDIDYLPSWNIIENVVPEYGINQIPTETFEITSIENELTHFMNVGLIRLALIGYINDLKKKFSLP